MISIEDYATNWYVPLLIGFVIFTCSLLIVAIIEYWEYILVFMFSLVVVIYTFIMQLFRYGSIYSRRARKKYGKHINYIQIIKDINKE